MATVAYLITHLNIMAVYSNILQIRETGFTSRTAMLDYRRFKTTDFKILTNQPTILSHNLLSLDCPLKELVKNEKLIKMKQVVETFCR
jgi:hypothetical protein